MMLTRISAAGSGRMPPLDSSVLDADAMGLLSAWITNRLMDYRSFADWQIEHFGSTNAPDAGSAAEPDGDGANNQLEYLTGTNPMAGDDFWRIDVRQSGNAVGISYPQIAHLGFQVEWSPGLESAVSWQPLDVPGNRPFFAAANSTATVTDVITNAAFRFYRVRVFEP
jgi:hypothetical protein